MSGARIVFVWELGDGLGHLLPIKQYCDRLPGNKIFLVSKASTVLHELFRNVDVEIIPAPSGYSQISNTISSPLCYAHLLHNIGFSSREHLRKNVTEWLEIFDRLKPDLVVFDHSPTALLAARSKSFKKIVMGSGFFCPPFEKPIGVFYPAALSRDEISQIIAFEESLVENINHWLWDVVPVPLGVLADIYRCVDKTLVSGCPELDHFGNRKEGAYIGLDKPGAGGQPRWPNVSNKKVFMYTHNFPLLDFLMQALAYAPFSTIVYSSTIDQFSLSKYECENITIASERINMMNIHEDCQFVITNGNFITASQFVLLGVPQICIPLQSEKVIFANLLCRQGVSITAKPTSRDSILDALNTMYSDAAAFRSRALTLSEKLQKDCDASALFIRSLQSLL